MSSDIRQAALAVAPDECPDLVVPFEFLPASIIGGVCDPPMPLGYPMPELHAGRRWRFLVHDVERTRVQHYPSTHRLALPAEAEKPLGFVDEELPETARRVA